MTSDPRLQDIRVCRGRVLEDYQDSASSLFPTLQQLNTRTGNMMMQDMERSGSETSPLHHHQWRKQQTVFR